jgi:cell division protein FtsW (lipid II flippase)
MDFSKITSLASSGVSGIILKSLSEQQKSNFEDVETFTTTQLVIVILIILLLVTLCAVATYKLTNSYFETILCIFFGLFYIMLAFLYYAYAGYHFAKVK